MQSAIEKTSGTDGQNALPVIGDTNDTDGQSALPKIGDTNGTGGQSALPEIENMEGAAFFAVCEALGVACCRYAPYRIMSANPSAGGPWRKPSKT